MLSGIIYSIFDEFYIKGIISFHKDIDDTNKTLGHDNIS